MFAQKVKLFRGDLFTDKYGGATLLGISTLQNCNQMLVER